MAAWAARFAALESLLSVVSPLASGWLLAALARSAARAGAAATRTSSTAERRDSGYAIGEDDGNRGPARGYDAVKKIRGRKRHVLVDTQGFVLQAAVHAADVPDHEGAPVVPANGMARFPRPALVWRDQGYRSDRLKQWMHEHCLPQEIVPRPRRACRGPPGLEPPPVPVFTVLPHRWVVEMSQADCPYPVCT